MLFGLEGNIELVFLALWLEFDSLLFTDEIIGIFNHFSNIRVWSDQLFIIICMRPTLDLVFSAQHATFMGIRYPSLMKLMFIFFV
jgi:hypothetical protein